VKGVTNRKNGGRAGRVPAPGVSKVENFISVVPLLHSQGTTQRGSARTSRALLWDVQQPRGCSVEQEIADSSYSQRDVVDQDSSSGRGKDETWTS
jgi:hypothetical protein